MKPLTLCLLVACFALPSGRAVGQDKKVPRNTAILFKNARIFDGKSLIVTEFGVVDFRLGSQPTKRR